MWRSMTEMAFGLVVGCKRRSKEKAFASRQFQGNILASILIYRVFTVIRIRIYLLLRKKVTFKHKLLRFQPLI
ncbi:hypothetical protein AC249_AIPGENE28918 [Exaiptasia diaphana]|nr:hypothetical protein AC249_AIPGENE28918 [Exaiptasia diaphana]